jgi:hypothetical protein
VNLGLAAAIVLGIAGAMVGLMYLVRRRSKVDHFFIEVERGAGVFAVIGTAFAVLLAFVVLEAFQSFNDARTGAEEEATQVLQLSRTSEFFPPADRDEIDATLICYGRAVIEDEWPRMKHGDRSPLVQKWVVRLQGALKKLNPETPQEEAAFLTMLGQADARSEGRRGRLTEANRALPAPVWFVLILGATVTIGFALFFADRRESFIVQGSLVAAVAILLVSGLLLVWFLDHPYQGSSGSIEPDEMERLLPLIFQENKDITPPCDENGQPVEAQA